MISVDLRHATIICTPETLAATLEVLRGELAGSIDARMAAVIVTDQIPAGEITRACAVTAGEIAAVKT